MFESLGTLAASFSSTEALRIYGRERLSGTPLPDGTRVLHFRCYSIRDRSRRCSALPTSPLFAHRSSDFTREALLAELQRWLIDFIYRTLFALYGSNMGAGRFRILRAYIYPRVHAGDAPWAIGKVPHAYVECAQRRTSYPPETVQITTFPITARSYPWMLYTSCPHEVGSGSRRFPGGSGFRTFILKLLTIW